MKKVLSVLVDLAIAAALIALLVFAHVAPWIAFVLVFALFALLCSPRDRAYAGRVYANTLILPLILTKVIDAYKKRNPFLKYFAFDISDDRVKFGQDVIARMPIIPTAMPHTPGADLTTGAQNVKDLIGDVPMKIDQAAKVVLKVPTGDAVSLELDLTFNEAIVNAGNALASYVIARALGQVNTGTITNQYVEAAVDVDRDTLNGVRQQLNTQRAGVPRFGLVDGPTMGKLTSDPRIASGDYHGKLVDENPFVTLENLEGFKAIIEMPEFPDDSYAVGDVTAVSAADDTLTVPNHGLGDGARVRLTNAGGALPAGLAINTTYYVRDIGNNDTFKLSATLGGAAIDITGAGTGTHTVVRYEHLEGFFFAMPAMLIAIRALNDNVEFARKLGIPVPILVDTKSDPESGLTFTAYMWITPNTQDIYVAVVIAFGARTGRQVSTNAANSLTDRSGVRLVTA